MSEFARRQVRYLWDGQFPVATAEDTIIAKLEWSKMAGGSSRQLEDVRELMAVGQSLDRDYIKHWVE